MSGPVGALSERNYTTDELRALRAALPRTGVMDRRGPAYYATGPYFPAELRRQAAAAERLIPLLRIAADALEREIGNWPEVSS